MIGVFYIGLTAGVIGDPFRDGWWLAGSAVRLAVATTQLGLTYRLPAPGTHFRNGLSQKELAAPIPLATTLS